MGRGIVKYINVWVLFRIIFGAFFVFVSSDKLIGPYQNFLFVVQTYDVFPSFLEELAARLVPWVEFFLGLFMLLGLWLRRICQAFIVLILGFIGIVGQAIIRGLPIDKCGCFGEFLSVPLKGIILFDTILLILVVLMLIKINSTSAMSLDRYYS